MDTLSDEVNALKKEKNAIVLAHNYQVPEIQDIADFIGDSLELSRQAVDTKADLIVFCGVDFMAETAKILNPKKRVVVPDPNAQCPMAKMLKPEEIVAAKKANPGAPVLLYVNTFASCKALADYACTSANAIKMVESIPAEKILFGPDKNLLEYAAEKTDKELVPIPAHGFCITHQHIDYHIIDSLKKIHPKAKVVVHPECNSEVRKRADDISSTSGMLRFCKSDDAKEYIVGTEEGLIYRMQKEIPGKKFWRVGAICQNMKRNTLEKVRDALREPKYEVKLPEDVMDKARLSIKRMLELTA